MGAGTDASVVVHEVILGHADRRPLPLPPISLRIDFGESVAIVGANGRGKSTLLKTIAGALEPIAGDVSVGRELRFGNLMQEHESLPRGATPREHLADLLGVGRFDAGQQLIRYGLTLRQVDCPIGELNPGARTRALISAFSARRVNGLLLDEPSNHLDAEALDEVLATLQDFSGTVLTVSHDVYFLQRLRPCRTLLLDAQGLTELVSIEAYAQSLEKAVDTVDAAVP